MQALCVQVQFMLASSPALSGEALQQSADGRGYPGALPGFLPTLWIVMFLPLTIQMGLLHFAVHS